MIGVKSESVETQRMAKVTYWELKDLVPRVLIIERRKTIGTVIKKENNSVKHIQRQQFSFRKTSIKGVSKNPES